jgi:hypothetical protein
MLEDGTFSNKIDYVTILEIQSFEEHLDRITGSQVMAILLNGKILPIGGASAVKGLCLQPAQQPGLFFD